MKIIEEKIIVEDGQEYKVQTYSNGATVKTMKPSDVPVEPVAPEPTQLDRIEEAVKEIKNSENSEAINALLGG